METLKFVDKSSWNVIQKQHDEMNWSMHITFTIYCFPLRGMLVRLICWNLKNLCNRYSHKGWWRRPQHRQAYREALKTCQRHPKFTSELNRILAEEDLPEAVLHLRREIHVPQNHPAFCTLCQGARVLYLSTAFSSLEVCRLFLQHLMTQKIAAFLIESASIRSLRNSAEIKLPNRIIEHLIAEEKTKLLDCHHPTFYMADQIFETRRLLSTIDLAPKPQLIIMIIIWVGLYFACHMSGWSGWCNNLQIPMFITLLALIIEYAATVMSMIVRVRQRLVFTTE